MEYLPALLSPAVVTRVHLMVVTVWSPLYPGQVLTTWCKFLETNKNAYEIYISQTISFSSLPLPSHSFVFNLVQYTCVCFQNTSQDNAEKELFLWLHWKEEKVRETQHPRQDSHLGLTVAGPGRLYAAGWCPGRSWWFWFSYCKENWINI